MTDGIQPIVQPTHQFVCCFLRHNFLQIASAFGATSYSVSDSLSCEIDVAPYCNQTISKSTVFILLRAATYRHVAVDSNRFITDPLSVWIDPVLWLDLRDGSAARASWHVRYIIFVCRLLLSSDDTRLADKEMTGIFFTAAASCSVKLRNRCSWCFTFSSSRVIFDSKLFTLLSNEFFMSTFSNRKHVREEIFLMVWIRYIYIIEVGHVSIK